MTFITMQLSNGDSIEVVQLFDKYYAKIHHQPFDKYIIVCKINFARNDEDNVCNITIYNPYDDLSDIIYEFNFLDIDGKDTLSNILKENLCRSVFYSQFGSDCVPYYKNMGFDFVCKS